MTNIIVDIKSEILIRIFSLKSAGETHRSFAIQKAG